MTVPTGQFVRATAATRIRAKLILLHTVFSLTLGVILILTLRVPVSALQEASSERDALLALEIAMADPGAEDASFVQGVELDRGSAEAMGLSAAFANSLRSTPGVPAFPSSAEGGPGAVVYDEGAGAFVRARSVSVKSLRAVSSIYLLMTVALLSVYALIALTLEVFVLPKQVYTPIERLRAADEAVQRGERDSELIPDDEIRRDELGEIMRSRNASIVKLRDQETRLEELLDEVERIASELKRKNHLLETARRNLADQDRLASLGMMSAGIAHELNTPLSVLKGCTEELKSLRTNPDAQRVDLMLRVIHRLERLSESLLDFARARPPAYEEVPLRSLLEESWTLVSLDRGAKDVLFRNEVDPAITVTGDDDRLTQVFVNLLRNAVDVSEGQRDLVIEVSAEPTQRDGAKWVSVLIADNGPGIAPAMLPRLFEPFSSTRLDAQGTGLGLAVAEGIVKEHAGVVLARNRMTPEVGAEFEVVLPAQRPAQHPLPSSVGLDEDAPEYSDADDTPEPRSTGA